MKNIGRVDWHGCYDGSWQGELVPDAMAHPAKMPFALAERIYRHMLAEGWLAPGDRVVDPFGGIAGTAFHALLYGLHWQGVELEPKFVALAEQNIALWNERYAAHMPNWGSATIWQGDSRKLASILADAQACVSSPPYLEGRESLRDQSSIVEDQHVGGAKDHRKEAYGITPGQLGNLPAGDHDAAISSPPYSETRIDGNGDEGASGLRNPDGSYLRGAEGWEMRKSMGARYGETPGNLGNLPAGDHDAAVSSPPYAETEVPSRTHQGDIEGHVAERNANGRRYSDETPGQLGAENTDTFWSAARTIVEQTYAVLKPGAVAAWVTGDFVRNKQRVPFGEQWLALCESVGFKPLLWAIAWKHEEYGKQLDIFGNEIPLTKSKVSFFRRLANAKNPDAAILNEDVIFVRKPATTGGTDEP